MNRAADERGLIGKIMVVWFVVLVLFGVLAVDAISIVHTHLQMSGVADNAARAGADAFHQSDSVNRACAAAADSIAAAHHGHLTKRGCLVDTQTGTVTISVRTTAWTLLVGRVEALRKFSHILEKSVAGPPLL